MLQWSIGTTSLWLAARRAAVDQWEAPAMRDQAKTKAQLVEELAKLRARVAELEATENMAHWRYKGRAKCPNWA